MDKKPELSKFKVNELIGTGTIGTVYSAIDSDGTEIALKLMQVTPFIDQKSIELMLSNIELNRNMLDHPKIVKVRHCGKIDDYYYVAMDLIKGPGDLESMMIGEPFEIDNALRIALDICEGLIHAHGVNIAHGDLKPGNILVDEENRAILNDFGWVTLSTPKNQSLRNPLGGTPKYMSPQQAQGMFISSISDIYSFGVILYELLTGRFPYDLSTTTNVARMTSLINESPPIPPRQFNKKISLNLSSVVIRLLEKDEELRYQRMTNVHDELTEITERDLSSVDPPQTRVLRGIFNFFRRPPRNDDHEGS